MQRTVSWVSCCGSWPALLTVLALLLAFSTAAAIVPVAVLAAPPSSPLQGERVTEHVGAVGDDVAAGDSKVSPAPHRPSRQLRSRPRLPANGSLRAFWDGADPGYAHIAYDKTYLGGEARLASAWTKAWLGRFAPWLVGARVVEYGIGGGLLGELLLRSYNVSHYTGLDISDRQLAHARARLGARWGPERFALLRVDELPDLSALDAGPPSTVLISQAVIQHFPSVAYFGRFAARIKACASLSHAMLQVRRRDDRSARVRREGDAYAQGTDVSNALTFKEGELLSDFMAPQLALSWETAGGFTNGYRFYAFTRLGQAGGGAEQAMAAAS